MWLDDGRTWPPALAKLLKNGLKTLAAFERRRAEIDEAARIDVKLRLLPAENPWQRGRDHILAVANVLAEEVDLAGWHCTRLLESEIENIAAHGMRVLSMDLVTTRLKDAEEQGFLKKKDVVALNAKSQTGDSARVGRLFLVLSRSILTDASGVHPLLSHWSGEAVYWGQGENSQIAKRLRSMGQPCIVVVAAPAGDIKGYCSPGERVARVYLERHGINTSHSSKFEGYVTADVTPERILRVIRRSEADFEALTGCARWAGQYQL